ncbi:MAG TPA: chemotaxis-specific protein-glutamate methyltransferase CheB [Bryobacteraceae bacterium]|nr:chemotaxis-specific protein-glutamate methyltransferase CheB [Bryobacteraceae bacterium]
MRIRTLVVDDSAIFGRLLQRAMEGIAGVEVIGRCANGRDALQRIAAESPDLVTLDIEMPEMNGLDVLRAIRRQGLRTTVVVVSAVSDRARQLTIQALELGAVDFLSKPEEGGAAENLAALRALLTPLAAAAGYRKEVQSLLRGGASPDRTSPARKAAAPEHTLEADLSRTRLATQTLAIPQDVPEQVPETEAAADETASRMIRLAGHKKPTMILIGSSTGGTEALARIIPKLPGTLTVPVLIVQHMPPLFTENLAHSLNGRSELEVREARDGDIATAGHVYIAPGGSHLKVTAGRQQEIRLQITADPPENNCRPAVDYLFRSAALAFPGRATAVILTGMGRDGTLGLRRLKAAGCFAIAQDEATCTVFGMPKEAIQAGVVDLVSPLDSIAAEIVKAVR